MSSLRASPLDSLIFFFNFGLYHSEGERGAILRPACVCICARMCVCVYVFVYECMSVCVYAQALCVCCIVMESSLQRIPFGFHQLTNTSCHTSTWFHFHARKGYKTLESKAHRWASDKPIEEGRGERSVNQSTLLLLSATRTHIGFAS